jgi:cholesterol transport system auxiliary component
MRSAILVFAAILLAGCVGNAPRPADIAVYDLGNLSGAWSAPGLPVGGLAVRASSWLDAPAQLYRLDYADPLRRHAYAESRWAAPPAELLERALQRHIVFGQPDFAGRGCRLALVLDTLEQRFSAAQASAVVLEVRARLLPAHGDGLLARRAFAVTRPAPTPDARGGVAATQAAVQALADEMARWLAEFARDKPQAAAFCARAD